MTVLTHCNVPLNDCIAYFSLAQCLQQTNAFAAVRGNKTCILKRDERWLCVHCAVILSYRKFNFTSLLIIHTLYSFELDHIHCYLPVRS